MEWDAAPDGRTGVAGGETFSTAVGGPTPQIKDGGSIVGTAGMCGCFRGCVFLANDNLCFLLEFEVAALSVVFCSAGAAKCSVVMTRV
jgi:hypothetical protein